ncbi:hypothetical protein EI94DRAFT_1831140 [Lactarius quietus]|nr:hypothetical protein EI94DRAFT_1831140 [Lactarius quietus]
MGALEQPGNKSRSHQFAPRTLVQQSSMSFLSVEPQSRVVLENYSKSLLVQFDSQLGIIADRYLDFFQERRTIETNYIDSLRRLHLKAKTVDASLDRRAEPFTTRASWDRIMDNLESGMRLHMLNCDREPTGVAVANTQQEFVDILDNDVINPLATFKSIRKEKKDESRKRTEEDLKKSATDYVDQAEHIVSGLQEAYFRKYHSRFRGRQDDFGTPEPVNVVNSEEVADSDFRLAVSLLNTYRWRRVENLVDGYESLEELVFAPITKNALVKYMDGMMSVTLSYPENLENFNTAYSTASAKCGNLAKSTMVEVERALVGSDASESNLRASFRRALSFSIPPPTVYRNYYPGVLPDFTFGAPLADVETNEDNVPKVMRICMEEVEKRGLNVLGIYSIWYSGIGVQVLQLRQRFESEKSFSFRPSDDIHSVARLLVRYLWDLPEPLFSLSLQEYRNYRQIRAKYFENDFSLLRSKIHELHPVQRASLGALLRHLLLVASHSYQNEMTVEALAAEFRGSVFRGNEVLQNGVHMKGLVLEDLIRNVHTLFDERPFTPPPVPSSRTAETRSPVPSGSFLNADWPQSFEAHAIRRRPGLIGVFPASPFTSSHSDATSESRLTPSPAAWPSNPFELPSSSTVVGREEMASQKWLTPEVRGMEAREASTSSPPPEVMAALVAEWRLRQAQLPPQRDAGMIPQSPRESVLSNSSDLTLSSDMSL